MKLRSALAVALAVFVALALAAAGCGGSTPTTPTPAPPTMTTETFTGTLVQSGANIHTFTIGQAGEVDATLTSVTPLSTLALGFILGTYDGTNCTPGYEYDNSRQGQVLTGIAQGAGNACVRVWDVGNILPGTPVGYTVTVVHP